MAADLTLTRTSNGDLRLSQSGGDLVLQDRQPGDLVLRAPGWRDARVQVRLAPVRGYIVAEAPDSVSARLQVSLPPVQIGLDATWKFRGELHAQLPGIQINMEASYDNAVWRGIAAESRGAWEQGDTRQRQQTCATYGRTAPVRRQSCHPATDATATHAKACAAWGQLARQRQQLCARHQSATPMNRALLAPWIQLLRSARPRPCHQYSDATRAAPAPILSPWVQLSRAARPTQCNPWQSARGVSGRWDGGFQDGTRVRHQYCWAYGTGQLRTGWGGPIIIAEPPIEPPEPPCATPLPAELVLVLDRNTHELILKQCIPGPLPDEPIIVPIRRVYVMLNEARLFRVSDNTEIPVLSANASIDADSWVWSVSASVPIDAQPLVQDDGSGPVELKLVINSHEFHFLAENLRRNRTFSGKSLTISGRGMAATLDAPYADAVTWDNAAQARTAVQLMEDALTVNGVPLGWTVDATEITDWLVPAGAWSHTGSHISAINAIAGAINALVQADPTGQTIRIKPRYPLMPWEWAASATPGIVLPENVVVQEGVEWIKSPAHNAVYVSGKNQGVLGRAIVEGTAGDDYAEMVTHDLITHADAVRQRGAAILGATGRRQRVSLSMPIGGDTNLPIIQPNTFIDYAPLGIGLSRGVRVDAQRPAFRQTVDVEVYLGR